MPLIHGCCILHHVTPAGIVEKSLVRREPQVAKLIDQRSHHDIKI